MHDPSVPDQVQQLKKAVYEIFKLNCDLGGNLTGEHGIGLSKSPYMGLEHDQISLNLMRSIKGQFDPNNILNPGKMALEI